MISWMLWIAGYYFVSRALLMAGAAILFDVDLGATRGQDDIPWELFIVSP